MAKKRKRSPQGRTEVARPRTIQVSRPKQPAIGQLAALVRSRIRQFIDWYCSASSRFQQNRRDKIPHLPRASALRAINNKPKTRRRTAFGLRGCRRRLAQPRPRGRHTPCERRVLLGCGLRRAELAAGAQVADLQQREEHWVFADLIGKVGHIRTV